MFYGSALSTPISPTTQFKAFFNRNKMAAIKPEVVSTFAIL